MKINQRDAVMYGVLLVGKVDRTLFTRWCYCHAYDVDKPELLGDPDNYDDDADVFSSRPVTRS